MKATVIAGCVIAAATNVYAAQDSISAARDLYASAAYEEALSTLARIDDGGGPEIVREAGQYRVFCLFALGRTAEAEAVAESLIRQDPLVQLDEREASPRIQTMFMAVRRRLLPPLIRDQYQAAKSARDAKRPREAEPRLLAARRLLEEARKIGAWDDGLADLAVLVDGFIDLTQAAARQEIESRNVSAVPSVASTATAPPEPTAGEAESATRVYRETDPGVVPPVAIRQAAPSVPRPVLEIFRANQGRRGVLEVLIDKTGAVERATMTESVSAGYDNLVLNAARGWKYRPATKDGAPVRYMKAIVISIGDRE